jgi:hypothetical protein
VVHGDLEIVDVSGGPVSPKLPRNLVFGLVGMALASFAAAVYLEQFQLLFLQRHPIMVNLISGVVSFSVGLLVVSLVIQSILRRDQLRRNGARFSRNLTRMHKALLRMAAMTFAHGGGLALVNGSETGEPGLRNVEYPQLLLDVVGEAADHGQLEAIPLELGTDLASIAAETIDIATGLIDEAGIEWTNELFNVFESRSSVIDDFKRWSSDDRRRGDTGDVGQEFLEWRRRATDLLDSINCLVRVIYRHPDVRFLMSQFIPHEYLRHSIRFVREGTFRRERRAA